MTAPWFAGTLTMMGVTVVTSVHVTPVVKSGEFWTREITLTVSPHELVVGVTNVPLKTSTRGMITTGTLEVPAPAWVGSVPTMVNGNTPPLKVKLLLHNGRLATPAGRGAGAGAGWTA